MNKIKIILCTILLSSAIMAQHDSLPHLVVLGVAQDGGYPHIACRRECCTAAWKNDSLKKNVVALALVHPREKKWWLFEATPDITKQLQLFADITAGSYNYLPDGIFITHAHIGHYTGLMQLGREALGAQKMPVYVFPKMKSFLEKNGPWSQLVILKNIVLKELQDAFPIELSKDLLVSGFTVPHRDEFSETAGFSIFAATKKYLFIPDIDKWAKFKNDIVKAVKVMDVALLDATFFSPEELSHRNVAEVPHPYVTETMSLFKNESAATKRKIHFIHFNHTNPLLYKKDYQEKVLKEGFSVAEQGKRL